MYQNVPPSPPAYPQQTARPRKLQRSTSNRRVAGVLGGFAEYGGVNPRALRVIYVLVSIFLLGGMGGVVLYAIAWALIPEEGSVPSVARQALGDRPWESWDRTARSWAVVLGALAFLFIWSFGLWPWWHWDAVPAWVLVAGVLVWVLARHSRGTDQADWPDRAKTFFQGIGNPQQAGPATAAQTWATATGPSSASGPSPASTASPVTGQAPAPAPTGPLGTATPPDPAAQEESDRAAAQSAAAAWAASQLAAAGVAAKPQPVPQPRRHRRRLATLVLALLAALLVLGVLVVGLTLWSGGSLRGGLGNSTIVPTNASLVAREYQWGIGHLSLDMSGVQFPAKGQTVHADLGIGNLTVDVPKDALVNIQAKSGLGSVDVFGNTGNSIEGTYRSGQGPVRHRLTLDAHVGAGHIDVSWAGQ